MTDQVDYRGDRVVADSFSLRLFKVESIDPDCHALTEHFRWKWRAKQCLQGYIIGGPTNMRLRRGPDHRRGETGFPSGPRPMYTLDDEVDLPDPDAILQPPHVAPGRPIRPLRTDSFGNLHVGPNPCGEIDLGGRPVPTNLREPPMPDVISASIRLVGLTMEEAAAEQMRLLTRALRGDPQIGRPNWP